jgi:hypothetical protein
MNQIAIVVCTLCVHLICAQPSVLRSSLLRSAIVQQPSLLHAANFNPQLPASTPPPPAAAPWHPPQTDDLSDMMVH